MNTGVELIKEKATPLLKEAGIKRSFLFGSIVRGDDTPESDIDILIEPPKGMTLFSMGGLQVNLEEILGRRVDLISSGSIYPPLKPFIESNQVQLL